MIDKERRDTRMAILYDLRSIVTNGAKREYTTEEIVELPDKIAMAKDQEQHAKAGTLMLPAFAFKQDRKPV